MAAVTGSPTEEATPEASTLAGKETAGGVVTLASFTSPSSFSVRFSPELLAAAR
jgi:hypothetical protein